MKWQTNHVHIINDHIRNIYIIDEDPLLHRNPKRDSPLNHSRKPSKGKPGEDDMLVGRQV